MPSIVKKPENVVRLVVSEDVPNRLALKCLQRF